MSAEPFLQRPAAYPLIDVKGLRRCAAEFVATFLLVMLDIAILYASRRLPHGEALYGLFSGLTVMVLIFSFGEISGAHLNPAITLAFVLRGIFPFKRALLYWTSQVAAALLGVVCLRTLALPPSLPADARLIASSIGTFFLTTVVLFTTFEAQIKGLDSAIPVGGAVAICGLLKALTPIEINPAVVLAKSLTFPEFHRPFLLALAILTGSALSTLIGGLILGRPRPKELRATSGGLD